MTIRHIPLVMCMHILYCMYILYTYVLFCMYVLYTYVRMSWCRDRKVDSLADNTQQLDQAKSMIQKLQQEVRSWSFLCVLPARCTIQGNLLSVNLKGDTKSVLFMRGSVLTIRVDLRMCVLRYAQGQNEEYLLSKSMH